MAERADLELAELLSLVQESRLLDVHTACMAIVQSYDPNTNTVIVQPATKRRVEVADGDADPVFETLPLIQNVPVQWPGGGGFALRFPIAKNDTVLLVFAMWGDAVFMATGQVSEPVDATKHGLSYAKAFPFSRAHSFPSAAAQLVAPSVFTVGDLAAAHLLARADKLESELGKIADTFSHFVPGSGGASFPVPYTAPAANSTACVKLKAE